MRTQLQKGPKIAVSASPAGDGSGKCSSDGGGGLDGSSCGHSSKQSSTTRVITTASSSPAVFQDRGVGNIFFPINLLSVRPSLSSSPDALSLSQLVIPSCSPSVICLATKDFLFLFPGLLQEAEQEPPRRGLCEIPRCPSSMRLSASSLP